MDENEPQNSFLPVLNRQASKDEAAPLANVACPLIRDLVDAGSHVFRLCHERSSDKDEQDFPLLASLLHVLDMGDATEVLIRESCGWPAAILARSAFEALLTIDFLLEGDTRRRSFCWWVGDIHRRMTTFEMLDPETPFGAQFRRAIADDKTLKGFGDTRPDVARRGWEECQRMLGRPEHAIIEEEYQRLRQRNSRPPNWFSLFGGPPNIAALANHLRRGTQYYLMYRQWSNIVHGAELTRFIRTGPNFGVIRPIRSTKLLSDVAFHTAHFVEDAIGMMAGHFLSDELLRSVLKPDLGDRFEQLRDLAGRC